MMNYFIPLFKQQLLIVATMSLVVSALVSTTDNTARVADRTEASIKPKNNMAIKAIIELQAHPGKRDELKAFIDKLVATHGPGGPGFISSTRYEVLDNPDKLIGIADWESAEAREAHMKAAAATGIYAPLKELLAEPFRVTIIKQMD